MPRVSRKQYLSYGGLAGCRHWSLFPPVASSYCIKQGKSEASISRAYHGMELKKGDIMPNMASKAKSKSGVWMG